MQVQIKKTLNNKNKFKLHDSVSVFYEDINSKGADFIPEEILGQRATVTKFDVFNTFMIKEDGEERWYPLSILKKEDKKKVLRKYGSWKPYKLGKGEIYINKDKKKFQFLDQDEVVFDLNKLNKLLNKVFSK